ncbi:FxSxx-COOH system tetratricopeptide repeat protein [Nonomuraea rubra]
MTDAPQSATRRTTGGFPPVWKVPPRNRNFTGREELLDKLRGGILDRVTAVVAHGLQGPSALHGLGGVGKTQMAIEYAYRYHQDYDLVWWIPADQPGLVRSNLAQLAPKLGVPGSTMTSSEDAAEAVLDKLRSGEPYSRWLLIFDNADEPQDLLPNIPPGPGHVLITSRNHDWANNADTVAVDVFTREESVEFLRRRMRRSLADDAADRLAEALGDLPLALEQSAALQTETGMSAEEYLQLLNERTASLLDEGKPSEYPRSMSAAWELSVNKLKEQLPEAMELLRCCAFFGPEPIPRGVFRPVKGPVRPVIAELVADPLRLSRAIKRLGKYALVRIEAESGERTVTGERTIQVHRLIQALLRDALPPATQDEIRAEVHSLLAGAAPGGSANPANWPRFDALLAHVAPTRLADSERADVREFALQILDYLMASGNYDVARTHVERFVERWTADSGPRDMSVLRAKRVQGDLLRFLGRYDEAYELDMTTLAAMREVAGGEHRDTLVLRNGIGADLRGRGLFRKAREHDAESVELHREVFGPNHARTLMAVNSLALDHGLNSDYRSARKLLEEAFTTAQLTESVVSRGTVLNLWAGLSRMTRLCGDYVEACDIGEEALAYGQEQLDADHPRILLVQKDLAIARLRMGEAPDALELAYDVHARYVRNFGIEHPGTLAAALCLANAFRVNDKIEEAYKLAQDAMVRYPKLYGADHPYYFGCASNVAVLLRVRGDLKGARELNERVIDGLKAKLGDGHHYVLTVAVNLASDLAALGDYQAACELGRDAHRRLRPLVGEQHPTTMACAANLAADLAKAGHREEAEALREETLRNYRETRGMEHPDALAAEEGRHLDLDFDPPPV